MVRLAFGKSTITRLGVATVVGVVSIWLTPQRALAVPFSHGDVFVSVYDSSTGGGLIRHYDNAGNLLETLSTGTPYAGSCTFDSSGRL